MSTKEYVDKVIAEVKAKTAGETEFHQAMEEVLNTLVPYLDKHPEMIKAKILERITEPERTVMFRVPWVDDKGEVQVNRGYRVEFNSAIGPYKGGLRFAKQVTLGTLKFLGFEQIFKNSLTSLPMGGGKGGSDFDPVGKSDAEVMRFCQSFMTELCKYIGPNTDVPAGDLGVGGREIGYMFGQYKRIRNEFTGVLTGKGHEWGGSLIRPEATGYGAVYFLCEMLKAKGDSIKGKTIAISGFGNVSWGTAKKAVELGAKVVTISGPDGYIYDPEGLNEEKVAYLLELRGSGKNIAKPYADKFPGSKFIAGKKPWEVKCDIAMTCALQNELKGEDAKALIANGVKYVVEVSNMGCNAEAIELFHKANIPFAPGKAANAGGVATSGLEMAQNGEHLYWTAEEVDRQLHNIMINIHDACLSAAKEVGQEGNYQVGANIAGFRKVAKAMMDQGIV
jgi:glutamate dehydrogenase (NADP+)